MHRSCAIVLALLVAAPGDSFGQGEQRLALDSAWQLSGQGTRVEEYRGARALRMRTGRAIRRDVRLQDGTIDFDMLVTPNRSFVYVQFRMVSDDDHEEFYFRPHKSSLPDAVQYAPVWKGESAWQLYHGPTGTAAVSFVHEQWTHVRIVLSGRRAALFIGDGEQPDMVVALARDPVPGYIALRSFTPAGGAPDGISVAAFANVVVRPGHIAYDFGRDSSVAPVAGLITRWQLSPGFEVAPGKPVELLPDSLMASKLRWPSFGVERNGVLVIGRHVDRPAAQSAAIARLVVRAAADTVQRIQLGFSDYVTVFVNGRPLFGGDAHYSFDAPRQDGVIGLFQSTAWLPLRRGDNEVLFVVSDSFGGWGLTARLEPSDGGRIVPPR